MDESYQNLIKTLEASVKKNGEKPLTNKWLLNILKKANNNMEKKFNSPEPDTNGGQDW